MTHEDLLNQARSLAARDPGKPKQVNLRRAVSAAYYAMFHFVLAEAGKTFVKGTSASSQATRLLFTRAFAHSEMHEASKSFSAGNLPDVITTAMAPLVLPPRLKTFAATFIEAQERRHQADYDLAVPFLRYSVLAHVDRVDRAINIDWPTLDVESRRLYLLCMLLMSRLRKRK